ncbi:hypothetical protein EV121DRAFT_293028 [Schizophyllum commune]
MHAALQIPELIELIFSHISEKNSLNALARTCRAFLEPALGRLWERIVTLEPFILLHSESKRQRDSDTWLTTIDDLASPDVARMRFYAPFVRDLDLRNSDSSFEIDGLSVANVARALSLSRDSASRSSGDNFGLCSPDDQSSHQHRHQLIFPNLRTFTLVAGYADALPALLAPSVTELDLILHYRNMEAEELQRTMGILLDGVPSGLGCFPPSVKKLHVVLDYPENQNHLFRDILARHRDGTCSHLTDTISPRLGDTIQSLVIDFAHLDTATLQAIATLPSLEHLEVYNGYRAHSFELDDALDTSPPQSQIATRLKSLSVDILTPGVLAPYISGTVLRILQPPALTHFTMERILSPEHLRQACADIACSSAAQTLTHLALTGDWTVTTVSPRDLRALHTCHGLVDLELVWLDIRFGAGDIRRMGEEGSIRLAAENMDISLEEEEIREMGEAWPRLRRFAVREVDREPQEGDAHQLHARDVPMDVGDAHAPGTRNDGSRRACSLPGLAAFARHLPNLEDLQI